jgi:hypothetical protein
MHQLEKRIIELGAIDTPIETIKIDEWFQNVIITFISNDTIGKVKCIFEQCFEVALKHDKNYNKSIKDDGKKDFEYFIQDVEILEENGVYIFRISAWPLDGQIVCARINISSCR